MTEAAKIFQEVLEIRKAMGGEKHPDYAMSLTNLAMVHEAKGDYATAETLHREAAELDKG